MTTMRLSVQFLALVAYFRLACAFQTPPVRTSRSSLQILSESGSSPSFLDKLPELPGFFASLKAPDVEDSYLTRKSFEPTPTGLIQQAGRVLAAELGLQDPSLLDDTNFQWISPAVDTPLGKTEYLAAGKFFDLRMAFPDYDYRSHDFRIDESDSNTIRLTCRTTGTMRGELRLRKEVLPPTGKTMRCPPEAVTMTFDRATGKVVKLCTGFAMDRLVGNTNGCTGVLAAAVIAGRPPSDWELYPPVAVVQRVFGRPVAQLKEAESFLAPFPETVMIQLVKGVLATDMGAKDPTLLADGFTYCTPYQGPIRKKAYLEKFAEQEFKGLTPSFSHFRIDPYDPVRVWVDVVLRAPGFEGVPQAMSFTFNEDGFCERITSGAVMDPTVGNAGGLGGTEGYRYATGAASPGIVTRPLPRNLGRFRKRILGLTNGVGVDEYVLPSQRQSKKTTPPPVRPTPPTPAEPFAPFAPKPPAKSEPKLRTPSVVVKKQESTSSERQAKVEEQDRKQQAKAKEEEAKQRTTAQAEGRRLEETRLADQKRQQGQRKQVSDGAEAKRKEVEAKRIAQVETKEAALELKQKQALQAEEGDRQKQAESAKRKQQQKELEAKQALQAKENARREQEAALKSALKQKELEGEQALQAKEDARREQEEALKAAQKQKELQAKKALQAKEDVRRKQESAKKVAVEQKQIDAQAQARRAEAAKQRKQQDQKKRASEKEEKKMMEDEKKRKAAELLKLTQAKARQALIEAKQAEAEKKRQEAAELRAAQIAARQKVADERKAALEEKRNAAGQQKKEKAALDSLASAAPRATIALFGFGCGSEEKEDKKKAPSPKRKKVIVNKAPWGVPTISGWRKKSDGSITGLISGSKNFSEGERVTTSPIVKGKIEVGEVVTTGSGSRYFLS